MKIAVPGSAPRLDGRVEHKMGTAPHLLVVDTDDMSFDVLAGVPDSSGPGAGVRAVSLVLGLGAEVVLVGYMAPPIAEVLEKQGVKVVTGVSGTVEEAVEGYLSSLGDPGERDRAGVRESVMEKEKWLSALGRGKKQFQSFLPRLAGVILLLGLFRGFVPEEKLLSLFSGSIFRDTLWGAGLGSILVGNPANSYIIGNSLQEAGVGLAGAAALMLAWVNVGIIQIPAEADALGLRFALIRNATAFVMVILMALALVLLTGGKP